MGKKRMMFFTVTLGILLLVTLLIAQHTLRQESVIVLPERTTGTETGDEEDGADTLNSLAVTPKTVQAAIRTLSRPVAYQRMQTVTLYWNGGKSESISQVAVSGSRTRIDTTLSDKSVCHTLISEDTAAVWYDDETNWVTLSTASLPNDWLQRMPTYETVLDLPSTTISEASYSEKNGVYCIYVKTRPDKDGYADTYWISAKSGLLLSAERTCHGDLIYLFTSVDPTGEEPGEDLFMLPDGAPLP